jgi:hypothetical protein
MIRRQFVQRAAVAMTGLFVTKRASAVDPSKRESRADHHTVSLGRDEKWAVSFDVITPDGGIEHRTIVVQGQCTIEVDATPTERRVSEDVSPKRKTHYERFNRGCQSDSESPENKARRMDTLMNGASERNNWLSYGSKEAFEREADTMVGGGG